MRHGSIQERGSLDIIKSLGVLGSRHLYDDVDYRSTAYGVKPKLSDELVLCQLLVNRSGGNLSPGQGFKWDIANEGPGRAAGAATGSGESPDGFVDGALLGSTVVPNGSFFLAVMRGPTWVRASGNGVAIAVGDRIVAGAADGNVQKQFASGSGLIYAAPTISTAYASSAVKTIFDRNTTIPANALKVGDEIVIEGNVASIGVTSTPTLTLDVQIGSVVVLTTGAVTVAANDQGWFRTRAVIAAIGASGSVLANSEYVLGVPGTAVPRPKYTAAQALDTTVANIVGVYGTWSASSSSNTAVLTGLDVYVNRSAGNSEIVVAKSLAAVASDATANTLFRARVNADLFSAAG